MSEKKIHKRLQYSLAKKITRIYSSWAFKIYLACGLFLNNHKGNDVETYSYK